MEGKNPVLPRPLPGPCVVAIEDLTLWTAVATWGLAIGTVVLLYWQTRQGHRLNSANAVIQLRERFDGPRMRRARRDLAAGWLKGEVDDITSLEVLTFFELVGAQTASRILDETMVWEAFGGWVTSYFWAMRHPRDRIGQLRQDSLDPLVFFRFEWLYNRVRTIDRRELGDHVGKGSEDGADSRLFLQREAKLALE